MEERLGEMRKGRRERIELRKGTILSSSPQGLGYGKLELKHHNFGFFSSL